MKRTENLYLEILPAKRSKEFETMEKKNIRPTSNLPFMKDKLYLRKHSQNEEKKKTENELNALKKEKEFLEKKNEDVKKEMELLKKENGEVRMEMELLKKENGDVKKEMESLQKENEEVQMEMDLLKKENREVKEIMKSLKAHLTDVERENETLKNEKQIFGTHLPENLVSSATSNGNNTELFGDRDTTNWRKINEIIEYQKFEREYKRNTEVAKKLELFIDEKVFEDESDSFIKHALAVLFTMKFFLEHISYKHEANRVCVRDSKILKSLGSRIKPAMSQTKIKDLLFLDCLRKKFNDENVQDTIQDTIANFKRQVRANPRLWPDE